MFYVTVIAWLSCFSVMLTRIEIKYLPTHVSNVLKEHFSFGHEDSFGPYSCGMKTGKILIWRKFLECDCTI